MLQMQISDTAMVHGNLVPGTDKVANSHQKLIPSATLILSGKDRVPMFGLSEQFDHNQSQDHKVQHEYDFMTRGSY